MIFLGGTAANNNWREGFTQALESLGVNSTDIFNPVVKDWNEEAQRREEETKKVATAHVYYIADPKQEGNPLSAYSMLEATMALYDQKYNSAVVVFDTTGMEGHPLKAMKQAEKVLRARFPDALIFSNAKDAVEAIANIY